MRRILIGAVFVLGLAMAMPPSAHAEDDPPCALLRIDADVDAVLASIRSNKAYCGVTWRILQRVAADPAARIRLDAAYDEVAHRDPKDAQSARGWKAWIAAAAGDPSTLLARADANAREHPKDKSLPNFSCWVRGRHGWDIEHAMPHCDAAVNGDGRPGYALINRGRVELALGQLEKARADFAEALANRKFMKSGHPMIADAYFGRGIARMRLGDADGRRDVETGLRMNPDIALDFEESGVRP